MLTMELPTSLIIVLFSLISAVRSQFQITSVNGRPVSGSASSSGGQTFGSSSLTNTEGSGAGDSAFSITSVNGRPVVNSFGGQGTTLLDTNRMRVEVQLVRFENPSSLMYDGRFCDTASKCDPRFLVDLDVVKPLAVFPGPKPISTWQNVFEITNTDVFNIGRSVVRDVCSSASRANMRVQVSDIDDVTQPDLIDEYDCIFDFGRIGSDSANADWSQLMECKSLHHLKAPFVKLFYRHREYALPRDNFSNC